MPERTPAGAVARLARRSLGCDAVEVAHHPVGFGNENWPVTNLADGQRYVLKIGAAGSAAKWRSAHRAYELAATAGVPVPRLVDFRAHGDLLVRVFTWIDGQPAAAVTGDAARRERLLATLGRAVGALHTVELGAFSSRLDGSAPAFARWRDYVAHRVQQVRRRCRAARALPDDVLDHACAVVTELAGAVSDVARPTVCHRDLHLDNLVVDGDGALVGIVDWDAAEAWDASGDWFKLDWMLLPRVGGPRTVLEGAYQHGRATPRLWPERTRLVHLIETVNLMANAAGTGRDRAIVSSARDHLGDLLSGRASAS